MFIAILFLFYLVFMCALLHTNACLRHERAQVLKLVTGRVALRLLFLIPYFFYVVKPYSM